MYKMRLLLFIGWANSGKSTLIRGISGCATKGFQGFIRDTIRGRSLYVISSSPQESGISEVEYKNAIQEAYRDGKCRAILLAIQPTDPSIRLSLEDCVRIARRQRQFEITAFLIAHPHNEDAETPSEENLDTVRNRLINLDIQNIIIIDNRLLLGENVAKCLGVLL